MTVSDAEIAGFIAQYVLPFTRISAMMMVAPVFGARMVSPRIRLVLAIALCMLIVPLLPDFRSPPPLSLEGLLLVCRELIIGLSIGYVFQIVFQAFVLAGQYMAMTMGLGFASFTDPTNGVQTTVLSQFFLTMTILMFISINGHLYLISMILQSFELVPIGEGHFAFHSLMSLVKLGSWMFAAGLVYALPVLISLLFVNMAFGVMSRAAPQLNIFAVGFPFTLVSGIALVWLGLSNYQGSFESAMDTGFRVVHEMINQNRAGLP